MNDEDVSNSGKKRRESIIEYVKSHPECDKQKVVEYCKKEGVGSRRTVYDEINKLNEEGILDVLKEKRNSKNYKLTVKSGNLLLIIPQDLEEIFIQFKNFVGTIKKICEEGRGPNAKHIQSNYKDMRYYMEISNSAPSLPYRLIEIINDIFTFCFILILPKKIDDQNIIMKLYSKYFEYLLKMYLEITKELHDYIPSHDLSSIKQSVLYQSYMEAKKENSFSKVYTLVRICSAFGVDEDLYSVLDLVWSKNMDVTTLLYEYDPNSGLNISIQHHLKKSGKENIDQEKSVLDKIHDYISYWVYFLEGSTIEDRMFSN